MAQVHYARLTPADVASALGRWSAQRAVDVRCWDGEYVVRSEATAKTFLMSFVAGKALEAIICGATHLDEIAEQVLRNGAPRSAVTSTLVGTFADVTEANRSLVAALLQLEAIGLARRAGSA